MGWLSVFRDILHAVETAAQLAAPIIATVDPVIGGLITQSVAAAVAVEAAAATLPSPMSGEAKAAVVAAGTEATVTAINSILVSQGKKPLPATTTDVVQGTVKTVVLGLKTVAAAVAPPGPAPAPVVK